jgi:hypothetical protein
MRHLILTFLLIGCSRIDSGTADLDLTKYQQERDRICATFDASTITRCDRSTFHILMTAMCGQPLPTQYESPEGKWNRDTTTCYPEDSRSETSRDAYLSLVLSKEKDALTRAISLASDNNGDTGLPSGGVGNISDLLPIMRQTASSYLTGEADSVVDDGLEAAKKAFTGHRGHLIAGYLWARARLNGGLTVAGSALLKQLHEETPDSPYLSCLYHRFSRLDNDQQDTLLLLDKMPHKDNTFGWGSSPWQVHYTLTVKCLEGK